MAWSCEAGAKRIALASLTRMAPAPIDAGTLAQISQSILSKDNDMHVRFVDFLNFLDKRHENGYH